jgi:drug/metabolite transporter (DMT)-like permease
MRRRLVGAALAVLGILMVLFEPIVGVGGCADCVAGAQDPSCGCHDYGSYDWWGLIHYPPGWDKLLFPMFVIGVALVVTGIVLLVKRRRSRGSPVVG